MYLQSGPMSIPSRVKFKKIKTHCDSCVAEHYSSFSVIMWCLCKRYHCPTWLWQTSTQLVSPRRLFYRIPMICRRSWKRIRVFGVVSGLSRCLCFIHHLRLFCPTVHLISLRSPFLSDYVQECIVGTGQSYRGRRSVTVTGILCQAWSSPIPHEHK